ncbi:hypothetical protein [uncultured Parasutterella sp.]|uniref:hypothetical protein n=1 Tax=uncultured Parasutterella sp. TaxID=1263098 RepID=UPI0025914B39|nr:hypothetical protein [uncultured Parasutterella sp.]
MKRTKSSLIYSAGLLIIGLLLNGCTSPKPFYVQEELSMPKPAIDSFVNVSDYWQKGQMWLTEVSKYFSNRTSSLEEEKLNE